MWLSHNFLKEAIIKLKTTNHRYTNNDKKSILITHVHINHTCSSQQDNEIRKYKLILLDKFFNLRVSIVNLEVGHRFILEQSIGHTGKQRSTNHDLNSIWHCQNIYNTVIKLNERYIIIVLHLNLWTHFVIFPLKY